MSNPTEPVLNGKHDTPPTRIAELEAENLRLRHELAELKKVQELDRECLISHMMDDLPKSEAELLRLMREGPTLKEVLKENLFEEFEGPKA
jgi:hypothetical protein